MQPSLRWVAAALVTAAAFVVPTWLSAAVLLPSLLEDPGIRWGVAGGLGAALAALAAAWGYTFAAETEQAGSGQAGSEGTPSGASVRAASGEPRPMAEVDAPRGLDDLPVRAGSFVGRTRELDRLDAVLAEPGQVVVQAVHGLGGIGKSTLAAHWAATRACRHHAPVRWINADSPAGVQQGLAALATALQPASAQALSVQELAARGVQWLATHTGWLLILDNVNDPTHIEPLLAQATTGRFLITSRLATTWHHATTVLRLDILTAAESLDLLTRITTAAGPRDLDGAVELCEELGHLPLAVEQAAAYLAQNPLTTPRAYLALLARHPADMYRHGTVTTPDERTIARVWNVTLDRITAVQPYAADLLRTLAWYAPENIPTILIDGDAEDGGSPAGNAALGALTAYSMIAPDPATGTLSVHRLVQAVARTPDPDDPHRTPAAIDQAREQATARLNSALPATYSDPAGWPVWRALLPHIEAFTDRTTADTATVTTVGVLNQTGLFLDSQGLPARAIRHFQRSYAFCERTLGADHFETLTAGNNLASVHEAAGDLDRAISLYEQARADCERVLGPDHPGTLVSRNNLAYAYALTGSPDRAVPMCEQNLEDRLRVLGPDHPSTLTSCNNLAEAYRSTGDLDRAITLHERTLEDRLRVLGADHPDTLTTQNNLAYAYALTGSPDRAVPMCEQNLEDRLRVLGADHPDTLTSHNNLAIAYQFSGDLSRAIAVYEQALTGCERALGPDHPITRALRQNLDAALGVRAEGGAPP